MKLTVALIVLNEERHLAACLETVAWADEIVVIDGGSSDRTVSIAQSRGATIGEIPFTNFSAQKNAALERSRGPWIFVLDADERVSPELAEEIRTIVSGAPPEAVYAVNRQTYFFGRPLSFSGTPQDWPIRLFPKGKAYFTQPVHEEIVTALPVRKLKERLLHLGTENMGHYHMKLNCYLPLEMDTMRLRGVRPSLAAAVLRPIGHFLLLYILRAGFMDGFTGFRYAVLSAYYTGLKQIRYWQTHRNAAQQEKPSPCRTS